tara:strand:+ start:1094 stop:2062 length:969 start_codon:yes stop_codon:yes gene_type:complete
MGICMNVLSNVYCLGCKTRHPEVKIDEVITMTVKGSIRYQGKGVCENGKTWCKILKPDEIPPEYLEKPPNEEVGDSMSVFEKGAEIAETEEPVVEEPVMEEPVVEEPVMEEPIMEEPVVEEPVVEEPVHVPEPLSPADIESFDIPIVPDTSEAPQTYYDGTHGLEEEEEEEIRIAQGQDAPEPVRVRRTPTFVPQRQPYVETRLSEPEPEPRFEPEPQFVSRTNEQDEIEKAKKVGDFMGRSMFNSVGDEYPKYLRANWERTKIPDEHFEYFEASYLAAGAVKSSDEKSEDSSMDAKTVAGIAGIGILAAWFASQLNNRDSP